jgi:uroporphyrinogen decarboxylase
MQPHPDFDTLKKVLLRQGSPGDLPFVELLCDFEMMEAFLEERFHPGANPRTSYVDFVIRYWHQAGYDYLTLGADVPLQRARLFAEDTAELKHAQRHWQDEHTGPILSWADFERFHWPAPNEIDYSNLEYAAKHLPDGMQIIFIGPGGQFENLAELMGLSPMSLALSDDPALVDAVAQKIGALLEDLYATVVQMDNIGAVWLGDDMGYKTSTMISPRHLRQYVFPYQKRLVEIAHARGKPFLLHSCGNLERVMDDLIDDVGIDGKHSYEDVILPVAQASARWGQRISILGGIDVDYLCRHTEEEVRAYTRAVIEACAPTGGFALGTGNTVANYIPIRNFKAMLDEGRQYRR